MTWQPRMSIIWVSDGDQFNLTHGPVVKLRRQTVRGLGALEPEFETDTAAGVDGRQVLGMRMPERVMTFPLRFLTRDVTGDQRRFWRSVRAGQPGQLQVGDGYGDTRYITAYRSAGTRAYDLDPNVIPDTFTLELTADDGWFLGDPIRVQLQVADTSQSWLGVAAGDPPMRFTSSFGAVRETVKNPGDVAAWPRWEIRGKESAPVTSWTLGVGDAYVSGTHPVRFGQRLVIDTDPRAQSAILYAPTVPEGIDVTGSIDVADFAPVPVGDSRLISAVVSGSGEVDAWITPRYEAAL